VKFPKSRRFKSEPYRRFVASLPCFACGLESASQCAHANGGGMGTKASDLETFPLCADGPGRLGCHSVFDRCIGMTWDEREALTAAYVRRMQDIARSAGKLPEVE
jgi:hypothetical protein